VLHADVVLDAGGRRSRVARWLEDVGVKIDETTQDCGLTYLTRYFRRRDTSPLPLLAIFGIRSRYENLLILGFTGDHDTYGIVMAAASWDDALKDLRHDWAWNAVAAGLPVTAPWVDPGNGTPLQTVATMTGHRNLLRHFFMPEGEPAVLGLLPIGDALCTTNPARAWGASMALTFAFAACEAINAGSENLRQVALDYAKVAIPEAEGVYADSAAGDRIRGYRWRKQPIPDIDRAEAERQSLIEDGVLPGIRRDPVLGRAFLRQTNLIDPPGTLFDNPEILARAKYQRDKNEGRAADQPAITRQHIIDLIEASRP